MGGSGSGGGAGQPYDLLGGQYASFSGGTPSGINWGGVGSDIGGGLQQFGQSMQSGGSQSIPSFGQTNVPQSQIGTGAPYAVNPIPTTNIDDAIMRLLGGFGGGGGGYG